ncbi:MAG: DUF1616 domain-containing protein [Dehalococcoidales bacterium]|nr:DUF1616 domain-containing protein [Dehalococcoidales bacterium]
MTKRNALSAALLVVIAVALILLGFIAKDWTRASFTDFYLLTQSGQAQDYPQQLTVGKTSTLIIGIVNHEGKEATYRVEASIDGVMLGKSEQINLPDNEKYQQPFTITPISLGADRQLDFLLYKDGHEGVYRSLFLRIDVLP